MCIRDSSDTGPTTLNGSIVLDNRAAWLGGGVFAEGPMTIDESIVTGNSAGPEGGGMVAWDGPKTVASSAFWNNSDQGALGPDDPAGVWVAPSHFGGFFTNSPTFTTTHSWHHGGGQQRERDGGAHHPASHPGRRRGAAPPGACLALACIVAYARATAPWGVIDVRG